MLSRLPERLSPRLPRHKAICPKKYFQTCVLHLFSGEKYAIIATARVTAERAESGGFSLSLAQLLLILWLLGAAGVLLWNVGCHLRFCRWLRRWGREAEETPLLARYRALGDQMGLRRLPRLVLCPSLPAPMLAGLLRPVILLPEPLPQSAPLECALRHELTHARYLERGLFYYVGKLREGAVAGSLYRA